jgi:uncharacterized membrane protein
MTWWTAAAPAIAAAFTASLVEAIEAMTIVLAVMAVRGPRPAALGAAAALLCLTLIVLVFGPVLNRIPIHTLQLGVGVLLLLFGTRWLRKVILRAGGIIPLHDEAAVYTAETAYLHEQMRRRERRLDWLAAVTSFKAVMVEGIEVVFIVIAVGTSQGLVAAASLGAFAACVLILLICLALRRPLAQVPENTLKFGVGVMLSAFGAFWAGEGMGIAWPGEDLAIPGFALCFLAASLAAVALLRRRFPQGGAQ